MRRTRFPFQYFQDAAGYGFFQYRRGFERRWLFLVAHGPGVLGVSQTRACCQSCAMSERLALVCDQWNSELGQGQSKRLLIPILRH
jgi:hypothetical protein